MAGAKSRQRHHHHRGEHHQPGQVRRPDRGKNDDDGDRHQRWKEWRKLTVHEPPGQLREGAVITVGDEVPVAAGHRGRRMSGPHYPAYDS